MISTTDRNVIRELADQWMQWANLPVMEQRKRHWQAVHDLRAKRPVILVETDWIEGLRQRRRDPLRGSVPAQRRTQHADQAAASRRIER
jgi:hypothetical protein